MPYTPGRQYASMPVRRPIHIPAYISGAKSITMGRCKFIGEFHNCEKWHTIALGIAWVGGKGKGAWRVQIKRIAL